MEMNAESFYTRICNERSNIFVNLFKTGLTIAWHCLCGNDLVQHCSCVIYFSIVLGK